MFLAGMFVYEEKILKEYKIKVFEIVGWEGVWGMLISLIFITIFFLLPGNDFGSMENPLQASLQITNNYRLFLGMLISSLVIGPFNYYGTNLTKHASAMHRCLIDSSRMCIIWILAVCCYWEQFTGFQAFGYTLIVAGNLLYYEIISLDKFHKNEYLNKKQENFNYADVAVTSIPNVEVEKLEYIYTDEDLNPNDGPIKGLSSTKEYIKGNMLKMSNDVNIYSKKLNDTYKLDYKMNLSKSCDLKKETDTQEIDEKSKMKENF